MQIERSHCRRVVGSDGCLVSEFNTKEECESTGGIWDIDPSSYCVQNVTAHRCIVPDISVSACSAEKRYRWFPNCTDTVDNTALHYIDNTPRYYSQQECEAPKMKLIFKWSNKSHTVAPAVWGVKRIESSGHFLAEWNTYYTVSEAASGGVQYDTFYDDKTTIVKIENGCVQRTNNRVQCSVPNIEMTGTLMASKNGHACVKNSNDELTCWFKGTVDASHYIPSGYDDVVDVDIYKDMACGVFEWSGGEYKISCWGNTTAMKTDWTFERFCQGKGKSGCNATKLSQQWFSMNEKSSSRECASHFVDVVSGAQRGIVMPKTGKCPDELSELPVNVEQRRADESGCLNPKGCNYNALFKFPIEAGSLDDCWYPFDDVDYSCPKASPSDWTQDKRKWRENPRYQPEYGGYMYNPGQCKSDNDDNVNGWCDDLDEVYGCTHTGACNSGILTARATKTRIGYPCTMDADCYSNRCLFCDGAYRCSREAKDRDETMAWANNVKYTCVKDARNREFVTVSNNQFCRFPYKDEYTCKQNDIDFTSIQGTTVSTTSLASDQALIVTPEMRDRIRCIDVPGFNDCPARSEDCSAQKADSSEDNLGAAQRDACCVCGGGRIFDTSRGKPVNDMKRDGRPDSWMIKGSRGPSCCDYNPFNVFRVNETCVKHDSNNDGMCDEYTDGTEWKALTSVCTDPAASNYNPEIDPATEKTAESACQYKGKQLDALKTSGCQHPDMCGFNPFATFSSTCAPMPSQSTCDNETYTPVVLHCPNIVSDIPPIQGCPHTLQNGEACLTPSCEAGFEPNGTTLTCTDGTLVGFDCTYKCGAGQYFNEQMANGTCQAVTDCSDTEYEFVRPGTYYDRVCQPNTCTCADGTANNVTCLEDGFNNCTACDPGFHLQDTDCVADVCVCNDATKIVGSNCSEHNGEACVACPATQHAESGTCVDNVCTCAHGQTRQNSCMEHHTEQCVTCDVGYRNNGTDIYRSNGTVDGSNGAFCVPYANCTCTHGTPASGCTQEGEHRCALCFDNYTLVGERCELTETARCRCVHGSPTYNCRYTPFNTTVLHQCQACDTGFFLNTTTDQCQRMTVCHEHQYELNHPTNSIYTQDRQCRNFTTIQDGQWLYTRGDNFTDNDFKNWTLCPTGKYKVADGTNISDTVCAPNTCTCTFGIPSTGAECFANDITSCVRCFAGYQRTEAIFGQRGPMCVAFNISTAHCGQAQPEYSETDVPDSQDRIILTNGIPNHNYTGTLCPQPMRLRIPKHPQRTRGEFYDTVAAAPMGILKSGALIYNHNSDDDTPEIAYFAERSTLDNCSGRAVNGTYRYLRDPKDPICGLGDECMHIGYMNDGFPIYSQCRGLKSCYVSAVGHGTRRRLPHITTWEGLAYQADYQLKSHCDDLDEANGFDFTDSGIQDNNGNFITGYAYVASQGYPFLPLKHAGSQWLEITRQCSADEFDTLAGCTLQTPTNDLVNDPDTNEQIAYIQEAKTEYADAIAAPLTTCPDGFHQSAAPTNVTDRRCSRNICTCLNGIAAAGTACETHGDAKCVKCDGDIQIDDKYRCNLHLPCDNISPELNCTRDSTDQHNVVVHGLQHGTQCTKECPIGEVAAASTCNDGVFTQSNCTALTTQQCAQIKVDYTEDGCTCKQTAECQRWRQDFAAACTNTVCT